MFRALLGGGPMVVLPRVLWVFSGGVGVWSVGLVFCWWGLVRLSAGGGAYVGYLFGWDVIGEMLSSAICWAVIGRGWY